ncbi:MAG: hypothetical protein CVT67_08350 [Actinobacteria bacterium HGW-Actinobacteria-7]|jgi:serpin B|nr:MAG: hypothetical protein CVT67_08350 [Actinobacteria bacterium HGW-Actinobacteria-7]
MKRFSPLVATICGVAAAATLFALSGCAASTLAAATLVPSGQPLKADAQIQSTEPLTGAINEFGLDLLKACVAANETSGNVIVSPVSVHAALSMTVNGAKGETKQQMRGVLHTDSMSAKEANQQWASLLSALAERQPDQTLAIANSLWARQSVAFKKRFIDTDRDYFGAQVSTLDFANDDVAGAINGWVAKNTHGMITRIVEEVPSDTILYLANAVYFKGDWITPFEHESTYKQDFMRADGAKVEVDMMHATRPMPYAQNAAVQGTRLAYEGNDTGFYILLPKPGVDVDAAMDSLGASGLSDLRKGMRSEGVTEVVLGLPKIDVDLTARLEKELDAMGMSRAFDPDNAQFSGVADQQISIGEVRHKTRVTVDEKGTEAAAATIVGLRWLGVEESPPKPRIVCDRPYLFAIVDEQSGAMLFLGVVNDPTK